jgi:glucoamylase
MNEPDSGPWEFGQTNQYHCYTYLFHWAGCMAAMKIGESVNNKMISSKAKSLMNIAEKYIENCYDPSRGAYMQSVGNKYIDAGNLQLITMNYLNPNGGRALQHLKAIESDLFSNKNIFLRYKQDDLGKTQNTFIICGFWYAEALAAIGLIDKAFKVIGTLVKSANHLGLFSEDADEKFGQWGNFPQTYSHVGLVNAIYRLSTKLDKPIFF